MTTLLKEVLKHEVYPAMGCTEPLAVAFCAATAAEMLDGDRIIKAEIRTDPGTYKNGMAVALPNTRGAKGNLLAAALGLEIRDPNLRADIFRHIGPKILGKAKKLISDGRLTLSIAPKKRGIYIHTTIKSVSHTVTCTVSGSHYQVTSLSKDGKTLLRQRSGPGKTRAPYKDILRKADLKTLFDAAQRADDKDLAYIMEGVKLNLATAKEGLKIRKVGYYLQDLIRKGFLKKDILSIAKLTTSAATDARMAGAPVKVMSSGEAGNQGVVAILVPYLVGKAFHIKERTILKSIALSHLMNSYIKVFTGELAPICGCAVAAGVGAATAIVYQRRGPDRKLAALAVNNVISDIGGMLCDGAKSGCALKVASSADSAIRSAYMAINGEGITELEGFIGRTAEETIQNIAYIARHGMGKVDEVILKIMASKNIKP